MARNELAGRGKFDELTTDMERMFDSMLGRTVGTMLRSGNNDKYVPTLDIAESPEAFEITVDLPGVKPEDVKVEMQDGMLTISGKRETVRDQKEKNYHRVERTSGSFYRSIALPAEVDVEKIDASCDHGVLHVKLPKALKQQPKKIEIRSGNSAK